MTNPIVRITVTITAEVPASMVPFLFDKARDATPIPGQLVFTVEER